MRSRSLALRGFSMVEILVVMAIIGLMSLITVPAFMNYSRANSLRSGLRSFNTDIRNCRERAIARNSQVRLEFDTTTTYTFYEMPFGTTTWVALTRFSDSSGNTKTLDSPLYFVTATATPFPDADANSKLDITFQPDGTTSAGSVILQTDWKNVASNQFTVAVSAAGKITSTPSHN